MISPEADAEARYDHYDDIGVDDAATIRLQTGYEPDGAPADFSAEAIAARNGAHDYYVREFRLHEDWTRADDARRQQTSERIAKLQGLIEPTKFDEN